MSLPEAHPSDANDLAARVASLEFENSLLREVIDSVRRRELAAEKVSASACDDCSIRQTCSRAGDPVVPVHSDNPLDVL